jgi:DNA-binding XRE family transcriptional regulator
VGGVKDYSFAVTPFVDTEDAPAPWSADPHITFVFSEPAYWTYDAVAPMPARAMAHEATSREASEFRQIARWLHATNAEVANLLGIGPTTSYAWEREGRHPRPRVARRLSQYHALLSTLVSRMGEERAVAWINDDPARRARLLSGDAGQAQQEAADVLFGPMQQGPPPGAWLPD